MDTAKLEALYNALLPLFPPHEMPEFQQLNIRFGYAKSYQALTETDFDFDANDEYIAICRVTFSLRYVSDIINTLAHEMIHILQWARMETLAHDGETWETMHAKLTAAGFQID